MQGLPDSELIAAVDAYFSSIRERDENRWLSTFADDAVCHDPVGATPAEGKEQLREVWRMLSSPFKKIVIAERAVFFCGSGAAVYWAAQGTGVNDHEVSFEGIS